MKKFRKTVSLLLAVILLMSVLPLSAYAVTVISKVNVSVKAPVPGQYPSYDCKVDTAGVIVDVNDDTYGECQDHGVVWFCNSSPMLPTEPFEVGKEYTVRVVLQCADGSYQFATNPSPQVLVSDQAGYIQFGTASYLSVEYTYPALTGYTVTFEANQGTGTMDKVTNIAGTYVIPECAFTAPTGKVFKCWKINGVDWLPGESYPVTQNVTLTAQWKTASAKEQVYHVEAVSGDLDSIAVLYGRIRIPDMTVTEGAPAYITNSTANLRWEKKEGDTWKAQNAGFFTPGQWRISTQVRIDRDAAATYELGTPFTLTVNNKAWSFEGGTTTGKPLVYYNYSMVWVYSPVIVIKDDPGVQPPVPVEKLTIRLVGYQVGADVTSVTATTDAKVNVKVLGFMELTGNLENLNSQDIKEATGLFSADKKYAVGLEITAKKGYDISGLESDSVTLEQASMDMTEKYNNSSDIYNGVYLLKAPAASSKITVTTQPKNTYAKSGATAKITVAATGKGLKYQWQYRTSSTGSWKNATATGNKTKTLSVPATVSRHGYQYRCVITDGSGNKVNTKAVTLYVLGIKTQPANKNVKSGTTVKFTVSATGGGLKYQWQYRKSSTGSWKNASATGSKTKTVSVPGTVSRNGYQYRCRITDAAGNTVYTKTVKLNVFGIKTQPKSVIANVGDEASFGIVVTGGTKPYTYTWQQYNSKTGKWVKAVGKVQTVGQKNMLNVSVTKNTYNTKYRCIVTDAKGNRIQSETVFVKKRLATLRITMQPESVTANVGDEAGFGVVVTGGTKPYTYTWQQYNSKTGKWVKAVGEVLTEGLQNMLNVSVTKNTYNTKYRCVITDATGSRIQSETVVVQKKQTPFSIKMQPSSVTANVGDEAGFGVVVTGGTKPYTYTWQQYDSKTGKWVKAVGEVLTEGLQNILNVAVTKNNNGTKYRCVIKDKDGNSITSNVVTLKLK